MPVAFSVLLKGRGADERERGKSHSNVNDMRNIVNKSINEHIC